MRTPADGRERAGTRPVRLVLAIAVTFSGLVAPAAHAAPSTPAGPTDCVLPSADDHCETWAAVYDDAELYKNSLIPGEEPPATDSLRRMAVSPGGETVFTLGRSCLQVSPPFCRWGLVAHRAATGDQLWLAIEQLGANEELGELVDITVSADGRRVYAVGRTPVFRRDGDHDPLKNTDVLTIAYDAATGERLWRRTFDGGNPLGHRNRDPHNLHAEDAGVAVAASPTDDRLYVTGYSDHRDTSYNLLVIAYDGVTGRQQRVSTYDTSSAESPYAKDMALERVAQVSPDGRVLYLGGLSLSRNGPGRHLLFAYQAHDPARTVDDGRLRWVRELGAEPQELHVAGDGSAIYLLESPNRVAAYTAATGETIWLPRRYNDGDGTLAALAASPAGDIVFVTGMIPGNGGADYGTTAYDATSGAQRWSKRYDGWPAESQKADVAAAVGVSPDGRKVYVTGTSAGSATDSATGRQATVAYDAATGAQLWVAVYDRALDAEAGSLLSVSVDGTVFTAGGLTGTPVGYPTGNLSDWAVQAYAQESDEGSLAGTHPHMKAKGKTGAVDG